MVNLHNLTGRGILLLLALTPAVCTASPFDGDWHINLEETDKVTVEYKDGSGMKGLNPGRVSVSVMGLPLPSGAGGTTPMSGLAARDPAVLTCTRMNIALQDKMVQLLYDDANKETLRQGEYRGRTTTVSRNRIEQKYKTSERRVRKTWTLRKDGRLEVSVRIKYDGDKARTYNRVFDRAVETGSQGLNPG